MVFLDIPRRGRSIRQRHSIIRLARDRAPQAYPLVNTLRSGLTLDMWLDYVDAMNADGGIDAGILAAVDTQGYMHGLFAYRIEPDLADGRVLEVENFIAADVCGRDDAGRDLIEVIKRLADDKRCGAIRVSVVQDVPAMVVNPNPTFGRFSREGLCADGVQLRKQVARA